MHTLFHIILIFLCVVMYFNILKHMDYIHYENTDDNNSFVIEYQNNRELQYLCDKDKILIFDSPYHIDYDGIIHLSNTSDNEVIEVPFNAFIKLQNCKNDLYYFSNSTPILDEHIELSNSILNPLSIHKKCHLLGGPQGYITPTFFHNFHRKFLYVSSGSIQISLQPLNSTHINTLSYYCHVCWTLKSLYTLPFVCCLRPRLSMFSHRRHLHSQTLN